MKQVRGTGSGQISVQTTERYLGWKQRIRCPVSDRIGIEPENSWWPRSVNHCRTVRDHPEKTDPTRSPNGQRGRVATSTGRPST
jgi:hypothetical protein